MGDYRSFGQGRPSAHGPASPAMDASDRGVAAAVGGAWLWPLSDAQQRSVGSPLESTRNTDSERLQPRRHSDRTIRRTAPHRGPGPCGKLGRQRSPIAFWSDGATRIVADGLLH